MKIPSKSSYFSKTNVLFDAAEQKTEEKTEGSFELNSHNIKTTTSQEKNYYIDFQNTMGQIFDVLTDHDNHFSMHVGTQEGPDGSDSVNSIDIWSNGHRVQFISNGNLLIDGIKRGGLTTIEKSVPIKNGDTVDIEKQGSTIQMFSNTPEYHIATTQHTFQQALVSYNVNISANTTNAAGTILAGHTASLTNVLKKEPDSVKNTPRDIGYIDGALRPAEIQSLTAKQKATIQAAADKAMNTPLMSVMDKPDHQTAASGDKHDYVSIARYANLDSKTGKYKIIDGKPNPDIDKYTDKTELLKLMSSVNALTKGYQATGKEQYAVKARALLFNWFINPKTKMNPNLNFTQMIPGVHNGAGKSSGMIESRGFADLVTSIKVLQEDQNSTGDFKNGMQSWFSDYQNWMNTNTLPQKEMARPNNQGTWMALQSAAISNYLGNDHAARSMIQNAMTSLLPGQISADASQPYETARSDGQKYSLFNLKAWTKLFDLGNSLGMNLSSMPQSEALVKAADYTRTGIEQNTIPEKNKLSTSEVQDSLKFLNHAIKVFQGAN